MDAFRKEDNDTKAFWRAFGDQSRIMWRERNANSLAEGNRDDAAKQFKAKQKEENLPSLHRWLLHTSGNPTRILDRCLALDFLLAFPNRAITKDFSDLIAANLSDLCRHFVACITLATVLAEGRHWEQDGNSAEIDLAELRRELLEGIDARNGEFPAIGAFLPEEERIRQDAEVQTEPLTPELPVKPFPSFISDKSSLKPSYNLLARHNIIQRLKNKIQAKRRKQQEQAQGNEYQKGMNAEPDTGETFKLQSVFAQVESLHALLTEPAAVLIATANAQDVTTLEPVHSFLSEPKATALNTQDVPAKLQSHDQPLAEFRHVNISASKKKSRPRVRRVAHPWSVEEESTSPSNHWQPIAPPRLKKSGPARPRVMYKLPYQV